ncbi:DoxX family protein [Teichococcus aerofrigidensis]
MRSPPGAPAPAAIAGILESRAFGLLARILLTFVFWTSGLAKLLDFSASAAVMEGFGLSPGWAVNLATLVLQLGASLLIILNRTVWPAALALAVFTLLTIPVAHPFWAREGEEAFRDLTVALEHVSVIGGLALAAILSRRSGRF